MSSICWYTWKLCTGAIVGLLSGRNLNDPDEDEDTNNEDGQNSNG